MYKRAQDPNFCYLSLFFFSHTQNKKLKIQELYTFVLLYCKFLVVSMYLVAHPEVHFKFLEKADRILLLKHKENDLLAYGQFLRIIEKRKAG